MLPKRSYRQARLLFGRDRPDEPSSPLDRVATPPLATPTLPTLESSTLTSATLTLEPALQPRIPIRSSWIFRHMLDEDM